MEHATSGHKSRHLKRYLLSSPRYWNVEESKRVLREHQEKYAVELQRKREEFQRFSSLRESVRDRSGRGEERGEMTSEGEGEGSITMGGDLDEQRSFFTTQDDPSMESMSLQQLSQLEGIRSTNRSSSGSMSSKSKSKDENRTICPQPQEAEEKENDKAEQKPSEERKELRELSVISDLTRSSMYTTSDSSAGASSSHSLLKIPTRPSHRFERSNANKSPRKIFS
jgi:hypothetical protein